MRTQKVAFLNYRDPLRFGNSHLSTTEPWRMHPWAPFHPYLTLTLQRNPKRRPKSSQGRPPSLLFKLVINTDTDQLRGGCSRLPPSSAPAAISALTSATTSARSAGGAWPAALALIACRSRPSRPSRTRLALQTRTTAHLCMRSRVWRMCVGCRATDSYKHAVARCASFNSTPTRRGLHRWEGETPNQTNVKGVSKAVARGSGT